MNKCIGLECKMIPIEDDDEWNEGCDIFLIFYCMWNG